MLNLVTDQRPGEPPILRSVMHALFEIRSLDGEVLKAVSAPSTGWTHESLQAVAVEHEEITRFGADGYLGGQWMGSTEV
ncbi:hypothetical protein [Pseudomonas fluorescens]|uniref:Uncharacterized protein n=1 Tax=Pseudomonas fluorescens TaxID=294 RepID=A0A5E7N0U9_PSEFL|nr:hypothetical protein [Pseudomonas fluorescens]VVP30591.1 hypothetical protein PS880_04317 [Pseudomonas fluorescens]